MNDGTTPLILAARLAVEGMVEELVHCHADVNAVDDHGKIRVKNIINGKEINSGNKTVTLISSSGKSALHWAAAVNNVEATLALLKNGANRDMQDNKVLFYVCLFMCMFKHLLHKYHKYFVLANHFNFICSVM